MALSTQWRSRYMYLRLIVCGFLVFMSVAIVKRYGDTEKVLSNVKEFTGCSSKQGPETSHLRPDSFPLHINKFNGCAKGEALVDRDFMIEQLPHFIKVYDQRLADNSGTRFPQQFIMWCAVRKLQPLHIIESGILSGYGSWILRQAAPLAQLILLDPIGGQRRGYMDKQNDTLYLTGEHFKDFADVDWSSLNIDFTRTLVYFDDHQSGLLRTHQASKRGFRFIMFDDNYDPRSRHYDNFSLRVACAVKLGLIPSKDILFRDNFSKIKRPLEYGDVALTHHVFDSHVTHYMEFPLPWASDDVKYDTLIKNNNSDQKYQLDRPTSFFNSPEDGFNNVCLVKLDN